MKRTSSDVIRERENKEIEEFITTRILTDDIFEKYCEEETLGTGAFGRVWRATNIDTDQEFAVKTIENADERALGREIKVMLEADHPNLVTVHEIYRVDEGGSITMHLVMDLVVPLEGLDQSDLFEYIMVKGVLSPNDACKVLYQTAKGMQYLNNSNVIHRDIKPENILLGEEKFDRIRVVDYGLARVFSEAPAVGGEIATANVGSDGYQAPETIGSGDMTYNQQVDVWSTGVVMYICLRGAPPFGLGPKANLAKIKQGAFKPMEGKKWENVPAELKRLIERMLTVDFKSRISFDEILLDPWVCEMAGEPAPDPAAIAMQHDLNRMAGNNTSV